VKRWRQTWVELNRIRILPELDQFDQALPAKQGTTTTAAQLIQPDSDSCAE
jgi:hypothetical protein